MNVNIEPGNRPDSPVWIFSFTPTPHQNITLSFSFFLLVYSVHNPWPFQGSIIYWGVNVKEFKIGCVLSRHLVSSDNLSLFPEKITFSLKRSAGGLLLKATHQCFSCLTWKGITAGNRRVIDYLIILQSYTYHQEHIAKPILVFLAKYLFLTWLMTLCPWTRNTRRNQRCSMPNFIYVQPESSLPATIENSCKKKTKLLKTRLTALQIYTLCFYIWLISCRGRL